MVENFLDSYFIFSFFGYFESKDSQNTYRLTGEWPYDLLSHWLDVRLNLIKSPRALLRSNPGGVVGRQSQPVNIYELWNVAILELPTLTPEHVERSSGRQVDSGRTCPGGYVWVPLSDAPPPPGPTVVAQTKLAVLTHEAWFAHTALPLLIEGRDAGQQACSKGVGRVPSGS